MSDKLLYELPDEVVAADTVILYDRETGAIRHAHHCYTWRGGTHPSREELEREAQQEAKKARVDLEGVEILRVDPRKVELDAVHHVDVRRKALVAKPLPRRAGRPG